MYYINSNNEKEEHEVTIENGIASFETDHFSTYIIAEKTAENTNTNTAQNPNTSDNIMIAVVTLMLYMAGVLVGVKYIKK